MGDLSSSVQLSLGLLPAQAAAAAGHKKSAVGTGKRDERDFYPTKLINVRDALQLVGAPPRRILDPCAGTGNWGRIARELWPDAFIAGEDLYFPNAHPAYDVWHNRDFCGGVQSELFDLVVMNPPFKDIPRFVYFADQALTPDGLIVALLRVRLLSGKNRAKKLWPMFWPDRVEVLSPRPSFKEEGDGSETGNDDYMLVTWRKDREVYAYEMPVSERTPIKFNPCRVWR